MSEEATSYTEQLEKLGVPPEERAIVEQRLKTVDPPKEETPDPDASVPERFREVEEPEETHSSSEEVESKESEEPGDVEEARAEAISEWQEKYRSKAHEEWQARQKDRELEQLRQQVELLNHTLTAKQELQQEPQEQAPQEDENLDDLIVSKPAEGISRVVRRELEELQAKENEQKSQEEMARQQFLEQQQRNQMAARAMHDYVKTDTDHYSQTEEGRGFTDRFRNYMAENDRRMREMGYSPQEIMLDFHDKVNRAINRGVNVAAYFDRYVIGKGGGSAPHQPVEQEVEELRKASQSSAAGTPRDTGGVVQKSDNMDGMLKQAAMTGNSQKIKAAMKRATQKLESQGYSNREAIETVSDRMAAIAKNM